MIERAAGRRSLVPGRLGRTRLSYDRRLAVSSTGIVTRAVRAVIGY